MKIAIFGTGYVGLVTGTCFAEMGNNVLCVDIDADKVARLQAGEVPIYEPGLETMVRANTARGQLTFTTDIEAGVVHVRAPGELEYHVRLPRPRDRADPVDVLYDPEHLFDRFRDEVFDFRECTLLDVGKLKGQRFFRFLGFLHDILAAQLLRLKRLAGVIFNLFLDYI